MERVAAWAERIKRNIQSVIYGKDDVIEKLLVALVCRGHVLLEDVPGVGKTILARALASSLGCGMQRLQCTPDLMPADVIGVSVYNQKTGKFEFRDGPVITNLLLVDEINRATPRTQSALLEAMEERAITIEGSARRLPDPFFVLATENPVEFDGTFPLPEAQKDRFFLATRMGYPGAAAEMEIMESQRRVTHPVADLEAVTDAAAVREVQRAVATTKITAQAVELILDLVEKTRADERLSLGASPRAGRAIYAGAQGLAAIRDRAEATEREVREIAASVLWKRIVVRPDYAVRGLTEEQAIEGILADLEVSISRNA